MATIPRVAVPQRVERSAHRLSIDQLITAAVLALVTVLVALPLFFLIYSAFSTGAPGERDAGLTLEHVNEGARLIQLRAGRHLIDLLPLAPGETAGSSARMDHVCLSVRCEDLAGAAAWLRRQGVTVEGDVVARRGAFGHGESIYIKDPDGYRIELKPRTGPHS